MLGSFLLAVHGDSRRNVRNANGGLGLVDVLAARSARAHGFNAQILLVDVDLHRLVDVGVDEHASKRRVPARLGVKRRNAHQAVHARFGAQVAVSPLARDAQRDALDACLVAWLQVQDLGFVATTRHPARVHPLQHLGPVLRLGPPRTGIDAHDGALPIVGTGEHAGEFHLAHGVLDARENTCGLDGGGLVLGLVGQVRQNPYVLQGAHLHGVTVHGCLQTRLFA